MSRFKNWQKPKFNKQGMTKWNWMCQYSEKLELGEKVDIGAFTYINAQHGVVIEEEVQIGSHCAIYSNNTIDETAGKVVIKKGARIGSHTVILPKVTIGEGAVVGAHSLVKKDVAAKTVVVGTPAREIKNEG